MLEAQRKAFEVITKLLREVDPRKFHLDHDNQLKLFGAIPKAIPDYHDDLLSEFVDFRLKNKADKRQNAWDLEVQISQMMEDGLTPYPAIFGILKDALGIELTPEDDATLKAVMKNDGELAFKSAKTPLEKYQAIVEDLNDENLYLDNSRTYTDVTNKITAIPRNLEFCPNGYMRRKGLSWVSGGLFETGEEVTHGSTITHPKVIVQMQLIKSANKNPDLAQFHNYQTISAVTVAGEFDASDKRCLKKAVSNTKGTAYFIPDFETCMSSQRVQIPEGAITGEAAYQATGIPTIAAINPMANTKLIAVSLIEHGSATEILILGDTKADGNYKGTEALVRCCRAGIAEANKNILIGWTIPNLEGENGDFNDLMQTEGLDAVRAALTSAFTSLETLPQTIIDNSKTILDDDNNNHAVIDLLRHLPDDCLIKKLSLSVAIACHLPESTVFLMGLSAFSSMSVRKWRINYRHAGSLPIGIYAVGEQPSGTSKSRGLDAYLIPFYAVHRNHVDRCDEAIQDLELSQIGVKKKDPLIEEQKKRLIESKGVSGITTNTTPEALEMSLKETKGSFACAASEQGLSNVLLGLAYGEGRASNNDIVLSGFSAGYHASKRVGRDGYNGYVTGGITLLAQSGSVETLLNASNGTGLSERFLMIVEPHNLGRRDWTDPKPIDATLTDEYAQICNAITRDVFINPKNYEDLPALEISNNGWKLINQYRNKIEPNLIDGGRYSHNSLRGAAGKADMQIMKVAANLHLLSGVDIKPHDGTPHSEQNLVIPDALVEAAINIVDDLLEHHLTMLESKGVTGNKAEWQAIIRYLSNRKGAVSADMVNSLKTTAPFKAMTGSKAAAIKNAVAEMLKEGVLKVNSDGIYSVK
jgi:hypothetical protein